jgi:hypothetical protein
MKQLTLQKKNSGEKYEWELSYDDQPSSYRHCVEGHGEGIIQYTVSGKRIKTCCNFAPILAAGDAVNGLPLQVVP